MTTASSSPICICSLEREREGIGQLTPRTCCHPHNPSQGRISTFVSNQTACNPPMRRPMATAIGCYDTHCNGHGYEHVSLCWPYPLLGFLLSTKNRFRFTPLRRCARRTWVAKGWNWWDQVVPAEVSAPKPRINERLLLHTIAPRISYLKSSRSEASMTATAITWRVFVWCCRVIYG